MVMLGLMLCSTESSSQPSSAQPTEDKATIYFYRYKQTIESGTRLGVYCDEMELARIEHGKYFVAKLAKGKHALRSSDKQAGMEIDVKGGETIYIRVELVHGIMKYFGRLVLVAKEQGEYELKRLAPLGDKNIKDKTKVVTTGK